MQPSMILNFLSFSSTSGTLGSQACDTYLVYKVLKIEPEGFMHDSQASIWDTLANVIIFVKELFPILILQIYLERITPKILKELCLRLSFKMLYIHWLLHPCNNSEKIGVLYFLVKETNQERI